MVSPGGAHRRRMSSAGQATSHVRQIERSPARRTAGRTGGARQRRQARRCLLCQGSRRRRDGSTAGNSTARGSSCVPSGGRPRGKLASTNQPVAGPPLGLTNAERQRRYRERRNAGVPGRCRSRGPCSERRAGHACRRNHALAAPLGRDPRAILFTFSRVPVAVGMVLRTVGNGSRVRGRRPNGSAHRCPRTLASVCTR